MGLNKKNAVQYFYFMNNDSGEVIRCKEEFGVYEVAAEYKFSGISGCFTCISFEWLLDLNMLITYGTHGIK